MLKSFGTTLPQLVLPRFGPRLSPFMPAHQGDDPLSPDPAAYMVKTTYKDINFNGRLPRPESREYSLYICIYI
ncbi:uncharacterized protein ACN2A1_001254 isoform 2-T11 [Glossina fuscipes fuscipes]